MPKILLADDNVLNTELLTAYLESMDCEIDVAADGAETLQKIAVFQPDVVLLDVMMPKLSGFEVCEEIKKNPATRGTMVLIVTALNDLGDIERAIKAGCDDYLCKPVSKIELLKRVDNMLKLRSMSNELERLKEYIDAMER